MWNITYLDSVVMVQGIQEILNMFIYGGFYRFLKNDSPNFGGGV